MQGGFSHFSQVAMAWDKFPRQNKNAAQPVTGSSPYTVCKSCSKLGHSSWIFDDRINARPFCSLCGTPWKPAGEVPVTRQRPRGKPKKKPRKPTQGENAQDKPAKGSEPQAESQAETILNQVWGDLPTAVQEAVRQSGWTPPAPPGLGGTQVRGDSPEEVEKTAAAALFKKADEETKKLLKLAGVSEPEAPPPTALEAFYLASKAYKQSTSELRDLVFKRVTLQARCDRAKEAYALLLREVSAVSQDITAKEKEVTEAHEHIKARNAVEAPSPLPHLADILRKAGVGLTPDQERAIAAELNGAVAADPQSTQKWEDYFAGDIEMEEVEQLQESLNQARERAKRRKLEQQAQAAGQPPSNTGKARSRSPKRQDKPSE